MPRRFQLAGPYKIRGDQLADEFSKRPDLTHKPTTNEITFYPPQELELARYTEGEESILQAVISAHEPSELYFERDYERRQAEQAEELVRHYLTGLGRIENPVDFGYAYLGRLIAKADGAGDQAIFDIVDQATATAYITAMPEWAALPVAVRQWLAVDLVSRAYDAMVIRLLLVS